MLDDTGSRFRDAAASDPNALGVLCGVFAILLLILALCQGWQWLTASLKRRREHYHSPEQVEQRCREREEAYRAARSASAERQARAYYRKHADLLAEECPTELFESLLRSHNPDGVSPEDAWDASRDIIARLQPIVRRALERRAEREQGARKIAREIRACREKITRLRRSGGNPDWSADEIAALQERIAQLNEELQELS
jgi:hypothetical protein